MENDDLLIERPAFSNEPPKKEIRKEIKIDNDKTTIKIRTTEELSANAISCRRWALLYLLTGSLILFIDYFVGHKIYYVGLACYTISLMYYVDMHASVIRVEMREVSK